MNDNHKKDAYNDSSPEVYQEYQVTARYSIQPSRIFQKNISTIKRKKSIAALCVGIPSFLRK
ncbi:MAG: hypothetical protein PHS99_07870 [Candidatus Marinimicrobia bacterium]|nr:hypothetical protein [Candidatus Neomarinimicrobiota bacterium]